MLVTGTLGVLAVPGMAGATPTLSAQSIIVNPVQITLKVNIRTNRDPSGEQVPF